MTSSSLSIPLTQLGEVDRDYPIHSSWSVAAAAGEPVAVVRVRNLQTTVQAARDAWGRADKAQPLLVSAEVALPSRFATSSAGDLVGADTVHYGTLSKAVLSCLDSYRPLDNDGPWGATLRDLLDTVWLRLTGLSLDGVPQRQEEFDIPPCLDVSKIRALSVTLALPKASLLGTAVSLNASAVFEASGRGLEHSVAAFGIRLRLEGLRVPTLIGVNANERLTKQVVIADIEIDKFDYLPDVYTALEALVVKTIEESTFETLEALGSHLAEKIMADFRPVAEQTYSGPLGWQIKISLQKPTAVPLADAPCVEIRADANTPP